MRDNMLINTSGHAGHYMGVDMNMEHSINYQKASMTSMTSDWFTSLV